jgi:hypothetical protein
MISNPIRTPGCEILLDEILASDTEEAHTAWYRLNDDTRMADHINDGPMAGADIAERQL